MKEGEKQESSRRGAWQVRRSRAQRGQTAGEPGKWPQGRFGQKPQEGHGGAPQCTSAAPCGVGRAYSDETIELAREERAGAGRGRRTLRGSERNPHMLLFDVDEA